jgi:hypothetical protein
MSHENLQSIRTWEISYHSIHPVRTDLEPKPNYESSVPTPPEQILTDMVSPTPLYPLRPKLFLPTWLHHA